MVFDRNHANLNQIMHIIVLEKYLFIISLCILRHV